MTRELGLAREAVADLHEVIDNEYLDETARRRIKAAVTEVESAIRTLPDTASRSEGVDRVDHAIALATNENLRIRLASCEAALEAAYTRAQLPAFAGEGDAKDAARYRFLREIGNATVYARDNVNWNGVPYGGGYFRYEKPEQLDAAIDAALAPSSTGSKESQ